MIEELVAYEEVEDDTDLKMKIGVYSAALELEKLQEILRDKIQSLPAKEQAQLGIVAGKIRLMIMLLVKGALDTTRSLEERLKIHVELGEDKTHTVQGVYQCQEILSDELDDIALKKALKESLDMVFGNWEPPKPKNG